MKKVFHYLKPYAFIMSVGFIIKFIGSIMDLFLPWILAYIIDDIIPQRSTKLILQWGGLMILCSFLAVSLNIFANRMAARVARNTTRAIRHDLFKKIFTLSSAQVDSVSVPSLVSRMTSDTYNIHQMVGMVQRMGVRAPILLIGGIIVTSTLDGALTLVLAMTLPFIALLVYIVTKKSIPMFRKQQNAVDRMVRKVRENIVGIRVIKALSKEDYEKEQFKVINTDLIKREKRASMTTAITNPCISFILNTGLTIIIIVGAYRVNAGLTEVGKIIAFLTYFTIILNSMMAITRIFIIYSKSSASAGRISEILDMPEDLRVDKLNSNNTVDSFDNNTGINTKKQTCESSEYHIEFRNVAFSYNKVENNIENISFKLKRGETLGIIGSTGAGKTTIVNLLMRFYDADSGEILIDGKNVREIEKSNLRDKFGVVFQNDTVFEDTILNNITLGRNINTDNINGTITFAQAKEFINIASDGINTMLSIRGSNLSGGQKQRLLIARALAAKPEILILDDSSSALDYKTDANLRKEIRNNFSDTTTIIIAQRISSIMSCDHIIVMEEGQIIGYGNHEMLIKECEIYKEISQSQMGGEQQL